LNGGVPSDGNRIQMFDCNGTGAQTWTFASDGTLRVQGQCAQQTGDGTVHITGCDARVQEQWRAAPGGTLLNLSSGGCLTDPDDDANYARVTVTTCAGDDADQHWTLP
jgi:Ricin-type beta-trefoil lectin domain